MRVMAIHFWDTRPSLKAFWPENNPIWHHNFEVMHRAFPVDWELEHLLFTNWVAERPCVEELVKELDQSSPHVVHWYRWRQELNNKGQAHLVVFNQVARQAYQLLRGHLETFDLVFVSGQDFIMANHFDANWFVVLHDLMERGAHPRNEDLGWYVQLGADQCNYVSHTVPPGAPPQRYRHNAGGAGPGLWKIEEWPYVRASVGQMSRAAECHLGHRLDRHCLYLKAHNNFYYGPYHVRDRNNPRWAIEIVETAGYPRRTMEIRGWPSRL